MALPMSVAGVLKPEVRSDESIDPGRVEVAPAGCRSWTPGPEGCVGKAARWCL